LKDPQVSKENWNAEGDAFDMPSSTQRFPDGAAYRIETQP